MSSQIQFEMLERIERLAREAEREKEQATTDRVRQDHEVERIRGNANREIDRLQADLATAHRELRALRANNGRDPGSNPIDCFNGTGLKLGTSEGEVRVSLKALKGMGFTCYEKIPLIKHVRTATGLGLKEAKELVDSVFEPDLLPMNGNGRDHRLD